MASPVDTETDKPEAVGFVAKIEADIHSRIANIEAWLLEHGGPALKEIVAEILKDELAGDSVRQVIEDVVKSEIQKYLSNAQTLAAAGASTGSEN